jgi:hypothetical protein
MDQARDDPGPGITRIVELVALVIAPFTTLTGLLYYFGWVRTNAIFGYFGIDANLLAYSPQDYLLRSVGVAFRPCAALLLGSSAVVLLYGLLRRADRRTVWHHRIVLTDVALIGLLLIAPSIAVLFGWLRTDTPLPAAVGLVAGAVLLEVGATFWEPDRPSRPERALRRATVAGAVIIGLFWSVAIYAQQTGERVAQSFAANPASMPNAVIFSRKNLALSGPGVTMTKTTAEYPYRYAGLRLFIHRNNRWFLLPDGWRKDNGAAAYILTDSGDLRVELHP